MSTVCLLPCTFPLESGFTDPDDLKVCQDKINSLPFIDVIREFHTTGNSEFVNTHIRTWQHLNDLLQSMVYLGLDSYDPILIQVFSKDIKSFKSLLITDEKTYDHDLPQFQWSPDIQNYKFLYTILSQSKKEYLKMAIDHLHCSLSCEKVLVKTGNLELIKFRQLEKKCACSFCVNAGRKINFKDGILSFEFFHNIKPQKVFNKIARQGKLYILQWAYKRAYVLTGEILEQAVIGNHLNILVWAFEKGFKLYISLFNSAVKNKNLDIIKWLHEHKCPWDPTICATAAFTGDLEILKWLRDHGCPWNVSTCSTAAWNGHMEILQWARKHGCPWSTLTCAYAVTDGHFEILKWLRTRKHFFDFDLCPWDEQTCIEAATAGRLEILKWAREHGCPWNKYVCVEAARNGHLEILKWARDNGCDCDMETFIAAVSNNHLDIVIYMHQNGHSGLMFMKECVKCKPEMMNWLLVHELIRR